MEELPPLLTQLENFFSHSQFTEAIHTYLATADLASIDLVDLSEEQPLQLTVLFNGYAAVIASQLEEFIKLEGTSAEALIHALQASQRAGCLSLTCMDYILASVEYEDFISLIADFKEAWGEGDSEAEEDGTVAATDA